MNILAVDTSSSALTVALQKDAYYEEFNSSDMALQHSETLMPKILELCESAKIKTKDLDLLVCTRGPGSFTGLRIGMAALKGIAYGASKSLVSVSTLECYANRIEDYDGVVVTALDAKKQRYYLAAFEVKNASVKRLLPDTDGTEADLVKVLEPYSNILVTGPDAKAFAVILDNFYKGGKQIETHFDENKSLGVSLIELGKAQFEAKGADDIGQGPVYLRKSDAEQALEERLKKEKSNG